MPSDDLYKRALFFLLFFRLVSAIGPARFSIFNYLAVAAGILWSMAVFRETPGSVFWLATALMLVGMHLALRTKRQDVPGLQGAGSVNSTRFRAPQAPSANPRGEGDA